MRDGRVGHQFLHVLLHHGHQADVDHGDQRQGDDEPCPFPCGIRRDGHGETQEAVGTQLQHDGGQHGRAAGGRLDVHVWQPGMDGPHGHLHGEGGEECEEHQGLCGTRQRQLVPGKDVKAATRLVVQVDDGDQGQQRAQQRIEEELERGVDFVRTAPDTDDQVHRNQRGLKEYIEQQAIQRTEYADHQAGQNQEGPHVLVHPLRDRLPRGDDHDHRDECRQRHEPKGQAIHTEVVVDIEAADPGRLLNELHRSGAELEAFIQRNCDRQAGQCSD